MQTTAEIAARLGVTERSVRAYRERGMPYCRDLKTGRPRYDLAAVRAWLETYTAGVHQRGPQHPQKGR